MGQDFSELKKKEDFKPAEGTVLDLSNYLLDNPIDKDEAQRRRSFQYVLKWMEGTPDYTFNITPKAMNLIGDKKELLPIYLSSLAKAALEEGGKDLSGEQVEAKAINYLIDYCSIPENNTKPPKTIKNEIKKRKE